jgi:ATP-binding cassette subfamily B protein
MENLTFGLDNPDMEEVIRCAKMAQIHEFVNTLPLRYETHLDENGSNLSGGQRQRIAIARAMLKKPDILILDEATSNLDAVTEKAIQETLDSYSAGTTTIIIAHRLSTIRRCDRIFVMEKGRIIESGIHDELMEKENGHYRGLYQAQTGEKL